MKIGEEAMRPKGAPATAPGARLILMNVFASQESSISEIATQTGLPQSYVSETVAKFRDLGAFETRSDPSDGRRTLVRVSESIPKKVAQLGSVSADQALIEAFGEVDLARGMELVAGLDAAATQLKTTRGRPGSPAHRIASAGDGEK
ncbi:MAG: MarR family transcriptional regulator [Acidimicrobiales bacterium]